MFRQLRLASSLLVGLLLLSPAVAEAHVLKQDNGIAAVMHIEPNDTPLAKQATRLEFAFGDNRDAFKLANCICGISLKAGSKIIQDAVLQPARPGSTLSATVTVHFPDTGKYRVVLHGQATDSSFPDFTMDYSVDVAAAAQNTISHSAAATIEIVTIALAALTVLVFSRRKASR